LARESEKLRRAIFLSRRAIEKFKAGGGDGLAFTHKFEG
jgi:hypothetical protein